MYAHINIYVKFYWLGYYAVGHNHSKRTIIFVWIWIWIPKMNVIYHLKLSMRILRIVYKQIEHTINIISQKIYMVYCFWSKTKNHNNNNTQTMYKYHLRWQIQTLCTAFSSGLIIRIQLLLFPPPLPTTIVLLFSLLLNMFFSYCLLRWFYCGAQLNFLATTSTEFS